MGIKKRKSYDIHLCTILVKVRFSFKLILPRCSLTGLNALVGSSGDRKHNFSEKLVLEVNLFKYCRRSAGVWLLFRFGVRHSSKDI